MDESNTVVSAYTMYRHLTTVLLSPIEVSFIFLRKIASRECVLWGPKMLKIDFYGGWQVVFWWGMAGGLMSLAI